jgi:subtilisin family serine protease
MTRRSVLRRLAAVGAAVTAFTVVAGGAAAASPANGEVRGAGATDAVRDSYIVVLKNSTAGLDQVRGVASILTARHGGTARRLFTHTIRGFAATMTPEQARGVAAQSAVAYVEQDRRVTVAGTQVNPPSWGLDRIDEVALPLDRRYTYPNTAGNVRAYVIDTGIRISHREFGGRAGYGPDLIDNDAVSDDCNGHGTHVAGTIGGAGAGVAKAVRLVAVRVLDCAGNGTFAGVIAGVDWVTAHAVRPAVANLSIGAGHDDALDAAVRASVASGVQYAVAAGNQGDDACAHSPADVTEAIAVGATDEQDVRASFSNVGPCVAVFAPGVHIFSASIAGAAKLTSLSGTSQATPHVTGAAALLLAANPFLTPEQVRAGIVNGAVVGAVRDAGPGSPNRLLHVGPTPLGHG